MFPVDLLTPNDEVMASPSKSCLERTESTSTDTTSWFHLSPTSKIKINEENIRRVQVFDDEEPDSSVLTLRHPDSPEPVAALFLCGKWWSVESVLQTSCASRSGLVLVQSMVERVILFLLSRVVDRSYQEQVLFSLHPRTQTGKLLWRDGQAVGFYTVRLKGSLYDNWSGRCFQLPVLDTVQVRRGYRRRGFGLEILEDFCTWFSSEQFLGLSSPLSHSMAAVCRKFLQHHEEHRERLYEVLATGDWSQRCNIWLNLNLRKYEPSSEETNEREQTSV